MEYQINLPEYISKCINKSKPQLQCNGKCALTKKIKEKEQNDSKKNLVFYEYSSLYVHKEHFILTMFKPNAVTFEKHFLPYLINYRFEYNTAVFRPPVS